MASIGPSGTKTDPIYADQVPLSLGTAIVIGTASTAIILSQVVLRTWRHVSLAQGRGLILGQIHFLVLILLAVSAIGGAGAFHYLKDDARALGGLFPVLGVFAPFIFLARARQEADIVLPTRSRFLTWFTSSAAHIVFLAPGFACAALCTLGMVRAESWDVIALAFSIAVAFATRSDPPTYLAWDGIGPRWQWGRLLPCPSRNPSWRYVVGRIEDPETGVEIGIDAMEVPAVDSLAFKGGLVNEDGVVSDRALADEIHMKGVLKAMPLFYRYVDTVWTEIIHGVSKSTAKEGRELDIATASSFLLIMGMLKEALDSNANIGADVWLLLAILHRRTEYISIDYIREANFRGAPTGTKVRAILSTLWSTMAGRQRGQGIKIDDALLADIEEGRLDDGNGDEKDTSHSEQEIIDDGDVDRDSGVHERQNMNAELEDDVHAGIAPEKLSTSGNRVNESTIGHYRLQMFQAFQRADSPPSDSNEAEWASWVLCTLEDLYAAALSVSRQDTKGAGKLQVEQMETSLRQWIGLESWAMLESSILETMEHPANDFETHSWTKEELIEEEEQVTTVAGEADLKVAEGEAWTYAMLSLASREIVEVGQRRNDEMGFNSGGFDLADGELNGRLTTQNMARKCVLTQIALWGYVALEQTATALPSNG